MSFNLGDSTPVLPVPNVLATDMETLLHPDIFAPSLAPFTVPGGILTPNSAPLPASPSAGVVVVQQPNNMWLILGSIAATLFFFGKRRR